MGTDKITIDNFYQTEFLQEFNGAPVCNLAATKLLANGSSFRVDLTVIGPVPEQGQADFSLVRSQAQDILQAFADKLKAFNEELPGEDTIRR